MDRGAFSSTVIRESFPPCRITATGLDVCLRVLDGFLGVLAGLGQRAVCLASDFLHAVLCLCAKLLARVTDVASQFVQSAGLVVGIRRLRRGPRGTFQLGLRVVAG